jgi:hypothetical protein
MPPQAIAGGRNRITIASPMRLTVISAACLDMLGSNPKGFQI